MRKRMTWAFVAATLALVVGVPARANDEQIGQQIVQRLQQQRQASQLEGFSIGVQVENGTVTISGNVSSDDQALLALDVARRVPGVKLVINDLRVQPAADLPAAETPARQVAFTTQVPAVPEAAAVQVTPVPTLPVPPTTQAMPLAAPASVASPPMAQPQTQPLAGAAGFVPPTQPAAAMAPQPLRRGAAAPRPLAFARGTLTGGRPAQAANRPLMPAQYVEQSGEYVGDPAGCYNGQYGGQYAGEGGVEYGGAYEAGSMAPGMGGPVPMPMSATTGGATGTPAYDNPQMPAYAWPSYASYPNYAALTYPHQYSPTAWPYIGPFYPYPQVPLGWRKVMLEWDDGWWYLDFLSK